MNARAKGIMAHLCASCGLAFFMLACGGALPATARAAAVAMVTDLQGGASLEGRTPPAPLNITSSIEPGARIQVGANARLVVLYLSSGDEYVITGPALVHAQPEAPQVLKGSPAQKRAFAKSATVRIDPARVVQPAIVLRSIQRMKLAAPTAVVLADSSPQFRWEPLAAGTRYAFSLADEAARPLHVAEVNTNSLELPASVVLEPGRTYVWEVVARPSGGAATSASAKFSVAPRSVQEQVDSARPPGDAALSERVAFAAWLDQLDLKEEARKYWRSASAERPRDERLKRLAQE